jgi:hypothetical protein
VKSETVVSLEYFAGSFLSQVRQNRSTPPFPWARRLLYAAFSLFQHLFTLIQDLWQWLWAAEARADVAEEAALNAQSTLVSNGLPGACSRPPRERQAVAQ